jgi:kinesin family protein C1
MNEQSSRSHFVFTLRIFGVHEVNDLLLLIFYFYTFISVGKTQMNEQSSRSHFVFILRIFGVHEVNDLLL